MSEIKPKVVDIIGKVMVDENDNNRIIAVSLDPAISTFLQTPLQTKIARLQAELETAQRLMKIVMDNLPSEDLSRALTPQWTPLVFSAYVAHLTIKRYFDSVDGTKESETPNANEDKRD